MIRYLLSKLEKRYLVPEQHELAQNGESFKILRKGPEVVANQTAVERRMEKHGKHCGSRDEVVRFACVQIVVVACPEGDNDAVQDISRQEQRQCLLHFENEIAGCVVRQVSLNHRGITL
jgi:hypothetical protein